MKKQKHKTAAKILFSWRKAMPLYYAVIFIIIALIIIF
jgi:hypothetical protein|tara:strand:- start:4702 stop:4815 length:114 start_codon:yes stop_codon:yes gene_type:complete